MDFGVSIRKLLHSSAGKQLARRVNEATLDLRERVVKIVAAGGTRTESAPLFRLRGTDRLSLYLAAGKTNTLAPKICWGQPLAQAGSGQIPDP
ncbi:MAG: hypothetical protein WCS94_23445 [Verrucomicrobiota bacterium]